MHANNFIYLLTPETIGRCFIIMPFLLIHLLKKKLGLETLALSKQKQQKLEWYIYLRHNENVVNMFIFIGDSVRVCIFIYLCLWGLNSRSSNKSLKLCSLSGFDLIKFAFVVSCANPTQYPPFPQTDKLNTNWQTLSNMIYSYLSGFGYWNFFFVLSDHVKWVTPHVYFLLFI